MWSSRARGAPIRDVGRRLFRTVHNAAPPPPARPLRQQGRGMKRNLVKAANRCGHEFCDECLLQAKSGNRMKQFRCPGWDGKPCGAIVEGRTLFERKVGLVFDNRRTRARESSPPPLLVLLVLPKESRNHATLSPPRRDSSPFNQIYQTVEELNYEYDLEVRSRVLQM